MFELSYDDPDFHILLEMELEEDAYYDSVAPDDEPEAEALAA